jgi:hypothetical protein
MANAGMVTPSASGTPVNFDLTWALLSGTTLTKAHTRKASNQVADLLISLKIASAKHAPLIAHVPMAMFEDIVEQPDEGDAIKMVYTAVHAGYIEVVSETLQSLIAVENITPVKLKERRAAAIAMLDGLETLSLGSEFVPLAPAPKAAKSSKTPKAPPKASKKPAPKPAISVIDESSSDDSSEADVEESVLLAEGSLQDESESHVHIRLKELDDPSVFLNPKLWLKSLKHSEHTPTLLCTLVRAFYTKVFEKYPHDEQFLMDMLYPLAKMLKRMTPNDPNEKDTVAAASRVIARYEFFLAKANDNGDAKHATMLENEILNISLPHHLREARKTSIKKVLAAVPTPKRK